MDFEADDAISKFERIADRRIQDAIKAGEFDNLPGHGKPLNDVDENPYVPADMRAALRVLKNSGYAPDWMELSNKIEEAIERMRNVADRHFAHMRQELAAVSTNPYAVKRLRSEVERLKAEHRRASARHSRTIDEINRQISTYNQMVPVQSLYKVPLSHTIEMEKFEDRLPAFLSYVK